MKWSELALRLKIILGLLFVVGALAGASAIYNWFADKPVISETFNEAKDMKKAKDIPKEHIKINVPIEILNKEQAVKKLKIGDPIKSNPNIQVGDTGEVKTEDGKINILSTIDTQSGKISIQTEKEPLSFFGFENDLEIYAEGGMNTKGNVEIGGGLKWDFARVANTNIGAVGEIRGSQDDLIGFAGVRLTYHRRR
jgi:hypothetical protein